MNPPWPSGRCCALGWLLQKLSSTTLLFSSTQRCISGLRQPVRRASAAAARSGAVTWVERRMAWNKSINRSGEGRIRMRPPVLSDNARSGLRLNRKGEGGGRRGEARLEGRVGSRQAEDRRDVI